MVYLVHVTSIMCIILYIYIYIIVYYLKADKKAVFNFL